MLGLFFLATLLACMQALEDLPLICGRLGLVNPPGCISPASSRRSNAPSLGSILLDDGLSMIQVRYMLKLASTNNSRVHSSFGNGVGLDVVNWNESVVATNRTETGNSSTSLSFPAVTTSSQLHDYEWIAGNIRAPGHQSFNAPSRPSAHSFSQSVIHQSSRLRVHSFGQVQMLIGVVLISACLAFILAIVWLYWPSELMRGEDLLSGGDGSATANNTLRVVWWVSALFGTLSYSCVLPNSYDFSRHIGRDAVFSGWLLGIASITSTCATLLLRFIAYKSSITYQVWHNFGTFFAGICHLAYFACGLPGGQAYAALVSRGCVGFGTGLAAFTRNDMMPRILMPKELETAMLIQAIALMTGLAMGPLLASSVQHTFLAWGHDEKFSLAAAGSLVPLLLALPLCTFGFLSISRDLRSSAPVLKSDGGLSASASFDDAGERVQKARAIVIMSSITECALGQYLCQSVEVGTSLLLEVRYGWNIEAVGTVVGLSLLAVLPVAGLVGAWVQRPTDADLRLARGQYCCFAAFVTCFFFVPDIVPIIPGWVAIVFADMIVLGLMVSISGVLLGTAMSLADTDSKSMWSTSNIVVLQKLGFGLRGFGGPIARGLIAGRSNHDQMQYALMQIAVAATLLTMVSVLHIPNYKLCREAGSI